MRSGLGLCLLSLALAGCGPTIWERARTGEAEVARYEARVGELRREVEEVQRGIQALQGHPAFPVAWRRLHEARDRALATGVTRSREVADRVRKDLDAQRQWLPPDEAEVLTAMERLRARLDELREEAEALDREGTAILPR